MSSNWRFQVDVFLTGSGRDVTLSGFGYIHKRNSPNKLQRGEFVIMNQKECVGIWRDRKPIKGSQICAKGRDGENTNSCQGDSGSGLVTTNWVRQEILIGVVSYGGSTCGGKNQYPSAYTNLITHMDWINNIIKKGLIYYFLKLIPSQSQTCTTSNFLNFSTK